MPDFFLTVRNRIDAKTFGDNPDTTRYLMIQDDDPAICPSDAVNQKQWVNALIPDPPIDETANDGALKHLRNVDIIIYIHGYNDSQNDILTNHRKLKAGLKKAGYTGQVVSFDWPCGSTPLAYLGDRHKAKRTAMELVNGGIALLSERQSKDCTVNIHVLAHSTGAYVVREAFNDAEDCNKLKTADWMVSQMVYISGDVSSSSLDLGDKNSHAIYNHCVRFTNYFNPYDAALALSNVKRAGFDNRAGRVGLPDNIPNKCADVNCGQHYNAHYKDKPVFYSHSWYFDDDTFYSDLEQTITGLVDRNYITTRNIQNGYLILNK